MAKGLIAALVIAYLALLHSPLRFAGDSPVYLCDAIDLATGRGFHDDHLPRGYPHVLAALQVIGLGSNVGTVAVNLASMGAGLVCIAVVLRRELRLSSREVGTLCLLSSLSWMWIALVTFPLSDLLFFAVSSMGLAMLSLSRDRTPLQTSLYIAAAALLAAAGFFVRTIGAALFVPVALAALESLAVRGRVGRRPAVVIFLIGVCLAAGIGFTLRDRIASRWYAGALGYMTTHRNPLNVTEEISWWRVEEVGELAQNVSSTALAPTTPSLPIEGVSPSILVTLQLRSVRVVFGLIALVLIVLGLWSHRRQASILEAYLFAFFGILLIWPFDDTRFLAPVLPLLLALGWLGLRSLKIQPLKLQRFAVGYCVVYALFGAIALGDALRVTYFDRGQPWRECGGYVADIPDWLAAYDHYGGVRPSIIHSSPKSDPINAR